MRTILFFICSSLLLSCEPPKKLNNSTEVNKAGKEIVIWENHTDEPLLFLLLEITRH